MGVGRPISSSGVGVRRTSYPSGPWVDANGNPAKSPNSVSPPDVKPDPVPKKLPKLPNPDPHNYKIVKAHEEAPYLVLKINYPDCTNYEGNKILVFKDVTLVDLINQRIIDPHFFEDPNHKIASPFARFKPTDEGWEIALRLVKLLKPSAKRETPIPPNTPRMRHLKPPITTPKDPTL